VLRKEPSELFATCSVAISAHSGISGFNYRQHRRAAMKRYTPMVVSVTRVPGRSASRRAALPPFTAIAVKPALSG
jgi:hypothetical protein